MKKPAHFLAATTLLLSLPFSAATAGVRDAAFATSADRALVERGAFVGASVSIGRESRGSPHRVVPSLQVAGMTRNSATQEVKIAQGLGLSPSSGGKPHLTMAGRPVAGDKGRQSNFSTVAAVGIGLGVAAVVGALVVLDNIRDENRED